MLDFLGRLLYTFFQIASKKQKFYFKIVVKEVDLVGIRAVPIILLLNFLIGVVLTHQGINTLKEYGQLDKIPDVLVPVYVRYVGPLISSLIVAGRSGSSFAAEIGSMKLAQEIDALRAMHVSPFNIIIVPKILASLLTLPLLCLMAMIAGIVGGATISWLLVDFAPDIFFQSVQQLIKVHVFLLALLKSLIFGIIISFIGCYRGMQVRDNAQILGLMTTKSVVECIFWVIIADGILSTYYSFLDV